LTHWALVILPVEFIQKEASHAFIDRVRDRELKQHLLMGGDRLLIKALNEALKLEVVKAAARLCGRWREVTQALMGTELPPAKQHKS
jgi:hypothetical protein